MIFASEFKIGIGLFEPHSDDDLPGFKIRVIVKFPGLFVYIPQQRYSMKLNKTSLSMLLKSNEFFEQDINYL